MAPTPQVINIFPLTLLVVQLRLAGLGACLLSSLVLADAQSDLSDAEFKDGKVLDWVPLGLLTDEQKKSIPISCCGAYVPTMRTDADATLAPQNAPFHGYADNTLVEQQTSYTLSGDVAITQGNRLITTQTATINKTTHHADMTGGIEMRDPGLKVKADSAQFELSSGEATLENARFVLYETRIHGVAEQLHKFGDNVINLEQSEISSCEPGDNAWSIRGSEISLYPDGHYGIAENMRINIKDVPVLYMPYVRFPIGSERLTGFLFPAISHTSQNGWDSGIPFYWNIAPEMDATITPRYLSERGPLLEVDVRHMAPHFNTELDSSLINNDHGGYSSFQEDRIKNQGVDPSEAYPYRGHNRWYANLTQTGGLGESWSTVINYADLSDNDFLRDMYSGSVDSNRQAFVRQMVSFDYRTDHWFSGIKADEYRLLTTTQLRYRDLPRIHMDGNYQFDDWVLNLNNEYVNFVKNRYATLTSDSTTTNTSGANALSAKVIYGEREKTDYNLTWNKAFPWGFVKPSLGVKSLSYQLDSVNLVDGDNRSPSFVVPQGTLDTGLYFEREADVLGNDFIQTLEPRAFYFYSQYKSQDSLYGYAASDSYINFDTSEMLFNYNQMFRTTRFAGGDRIDDANQVSLALSSAFVSQSTGVERLRVSLGQTFYRDDRKVSAYHNSLHLPDDNTRPTSDVVAQATGQVGQTLHLSTDVAYDQRNGHLDNAEAGMHYLDESYRIFNITYRYTLKPVAVDPSQVQAQTQALDQVDASAVWPLSNRWSVIARRNHDFTYGVELDRFIGFEYNDCCYRARIIGRRWLRIDYTTPDFLSTVTKHDYEPVLMFELELKGLGSMDQQISRLLGKAIAGFKDREKNLR